MVTATTPKELGEKGLESQAGGKVGSQMWVRMPPKHAEVYEKGIVLEASTGTKIKVQLPDNTVEEYPISDVLPCNTESDLADICALTYLSEAAVLDCIKVRFIKKKIYTWTARILIAMNPFERLTIYDDDAKAEYAKLDPRSAPPHIFAIGEHAYRSIAKKGKYTNQAIIVSGESGSGKTVGNKLLMDYFAYRSGNASTSKVTEQISRVMQDSNPVLEAFGNAKTTRNSNSSRFGKFQIMNFSERGEIGTITIATYLLEKSRVTSIGDPERNYHVFYQLLVGGVEFLPEFELSADMGSYYYLNQSTCLSIDTIDDLAEYKLMYDAMLVIGADAATTKQIFCLLAAVLHMGNCKFVAGGDDSATIPDQDRLGKAARRLGVPVDALNIVLTTRELKGPKGGGTITKGLSCSAAERGRDSIAKAVFVKLFDWVVACINETIRVIGESGGEGAAAAQAEERFVGLVDLFGFEQFKVNSFEQLCINFANERLQQFFLQYVFYTEETIHKEEGVTWPAVELPDNQGAIDVISKKDTGILFLLDGMSKLASAKEGAFFESVNEGHKKSRFYKKPKGLRNDEGFTVKHYAGDVTYHAGTYATGPEGVTWLDKNNYALAADQQRLLGSSSVGVLSELFSEAEAAGGDAAAPKKKVPQVKSAAKAFISNLDDLMTVLKSTSVQFVRCVKSCAEQKPGICSGKMVLNQLRCNGTMEAVEVMQAAFPSRIAYDLIHGNIVGYLPEFMQKMKPNEFFEVLMAALDIPREKYQLGLTKLFMKAGTGKALEELAEMDVDTMVPILLKKVEEFQKKKNAGIKIKATALQWQKRRRFLKMKTAVLKIQRIKRAITTRRKFVLLVQTVVEVQKELLAQQKREEEERRQQQAELEQQAAAQAKQQAEAEAAKRAAEAAAAAAKQSGDNDAADAAEAAAAEASIAEAKAKKEMADTEQERASLAVDEMEAAAAGPLKIDLYSEPDIGDRLEGGAVEDDMTQKFKERVSSLMQEKEQEQQAAAEQRRSQFQSVGSVDEDDDEDYDDEDDYSDFDEDDETTLGGRADADDKVFEVIIVRNESTGSLGLELDEYKGSPTVCAIMLGGPADQDGTLQMGDTVVAIDGKPTHNMDDVKRAVISAASSSLRLAVLRKPVQVLKRERAYMNMPDVAEDEEWDQFELTLFSNRQLTFEKLAPPFIFGSIDLPAAKSLRLMKVQFNVCLQIATAERTYEFYTDSLMTLYEWQRMLRTLMLSNTVSIMSGWLTLLNNEETHLKRWWFDLCGSTYELCYFETDQCQALNLPAQGCIDLSEVRLIDSMDAEQIRPMIDKRQPADGSPLMETVRLMCDVVRTDETMPIGLMLDDHYVITRFGAGSPAEESSGEGGLQVGDRLLAVDGHEVDTAAPAAAGKKGGSKKNKAVRELMRDLDMFPKQVHTFTVERSVPVAVQDTGAIQIKAKSEHWILYPCSADEFPLNEEEYEGALQQWTQGLQDCAKEARDAKDGSKHEMVLQQLWVELEDDDGEWTPFYCTLSSGRGLAFYDEKEDAQNEPDKPVRTLGLDHVRGAGRAPGIDFYDGVIDIDVYGFEFNDMWRIRPSGHAAMHNLLSAINIYKIPPTAAQLAAGNATQRGKGDAKGGDGGGSAGGGGLMGGLLSFRGGKTSRGAGESTSRGGGGGGGGGGGVSSREERSGGMSFRALFGGGGGSKKETRGGGMATLTEDEDVVPELSAKRRGSSSLLRRASSFGTSGSRKEAKADGGTSNRAGRSSRFSVFGRSKSPKR